MTTIQRLFSFFMIFSLFTVPIVGAKGWDADLAATDCLVIETKPGTLLVRDTKGKVHNVKDDHAKMFVTNKCSYKVNVTQGCGPSSGKMSLKLRGQQTYLFPHWGSFDLRPGQTYRQYQQENCRADGMGGLDVLACKAPARPYFLSSRLTRGGDVSYSCLE